MEGKITLTASIVLYKEKLDELKRTVQSFLSIPILSKKLYLIDNTITSDFKGCFTDDRIIYIENKKNIGFGRGHNLIIEEIKDTSLYHLILNPDVFFKGSVIVRLIEVFKDQKEVSMIAPKVLFPDGSYQSSCRRYPTFLELFARRTGPFKKLFSKRIAKGEYKDKDTSSSFYPAYITGCFQLYKTDDFIEIDGFDTRYFLYMEDVDICRKIDVINKKKQYFPEEVIYHNLKQGSSKKINLFLHHLSSAVKYFKKWRNNL